jgi:hypothetical protein
MELHVENVNQALASGIHWLLDAGVREESRNGPVLVSPEPVTTIYRFPCERVLFSEIRDANPFFHLMEALWMLAGRNDLRWPLYFNSKFGAFSDNGLTVWGAYGYRWRKWFGDDQLKRIIKELKADPKTRRIVLSMWDGSKNADLRKAFNGGKDVPCNTHAYFQIRNNKLDMTVCNRSNDIIWGAYGANAVHFSILQEYIAGHVGVDVGLYHQFSNNYHLYPALYTKTGEDMNLALSRLAINAELDDYYKNPNVNPGSLMREPETWDEELRWFFVDPTGSEVHFTETFFEHCAVPMYRAWQARKEKTSSGAQFLTPSMRNFYPDWYHAAWRWIHRREATKAIQMPSCGDCGKATELCACHRVL